MTQLNLFPDSFDGDDYRPPFDFNRLKSQAAHIFKLMLDGQWRTLSEIAEITGYGESSISSQLRNFRKKPFGRHGVDRQRRGRPGVGLYEYRLIVRAQA